MTTRRERGFYGWKLVGALWLLDMLNMGFPLYCAAIIHTYMLKQIPMERTTFGLGYTLVNFFIGVPSMVIGAVIIRWGIRATLVIGSALILAGSLWLALVARLSWHYLVGFGVLIGSGVGFGTVMPMATAITRWFVRFRGRAMAITLTAWGVAGFFGAPQFNRMLEANGGNFRMAWLAIGALSVVSAGIAWLFVVEHPEDLGQQPDGVEAKEDARAERHEPGNASRPAWTPREAYRTRTYWLIYIGSIACQFPSFFFTAHGILHMKMAGISAAAAAWAMGLYTLGGLAGRLLGGVLVDKIAERFAFMIGVSFYVLGTVLALRINAEQLWIADAAAMLYGAGMGSSFICLNTITGNYYGPAAFPKLNGTMMMLSGMVCCLSGVIGGKLFDLNGSYAPAFLLNLILCAAGLGALALAKAPQRVEALRRDPAVAEAS
ncbi:MAG TPA: MFS transporter [Candidatus Acidoferrales bacterium]|nr:MFS transporter [Candidatus Acidoferrales bacterium]